MRIAANKDGIEVQKGERFTIPKGFIQLSLDPASNGKLFRPGLSFLLKQFFLANYPKTAKDFTLFTDSLIEEADLILKNSKLLEGLDLDEEADGKTAIDKIKEDEWSREFYAMCMGAYTQQTKEEIENDNATNAAWSGYMLGIFRGLTIVTEPQFEQTLWRGYLSNQVVYDAAAAASKTPAEAEAIKKLEPLFRNLDEATLHTLVESNLPIGPRIGVKNLPEEIICALAKWHLSSFQREREQVEKNKIDRRANTELRIKWLALGVSLIVGIIAVVRIFL